MVWVKIPPVEIINLSSAIRIYITDQSARSGYGHAIVADFSEHRQLVIDKAKTFEEAVVLLEDYYNKLNTNHQVTNVVNKVVTKPKPKPKVPAKKPTKKIVAP